MMASKSEQILCRKSSIEKIAVANKMIASLSAHTFEDTDAENSFDNYFLVGDVDLFITLVNSFTQTREKCYKRDKLVSLMGAYIYGQSLESLLLDNTCKSWSNAVEDDIVSDHLQTILVSLPEMVANVMHANTPSLFARNAYLTRVVRVIQACAQHVYDLVRRELDCSLQFISLLTGRICLNGYSDIVCKYLLSDLVMKCENDFIWRRIANRLLVSSQKDEYIEIVIKTIFNFGSDYRSINWLIANLVEVNNKVKFLLTNKFLLIHHYSDDTILSNIFGYLSAVSFTNFLVGYKNLLNAWSNGSSLKYRSYSQHYYLSRGLMIGAKFLKSADFSSDCDSFRRLTMNGIEVHLKCSQRDVRNVGLTVGQTLIILFSPDNSKISFEIEESDDVKHLLDLFNTSDDFKTTIQENNISTEDQLKIETEQSMDKNSSKLSTNNLDSDDDDDLIPYDMSNDIPIEKVKKPVYLRDCMKGLLESEKPEWMQTCLENAETIIRSNDDCVAEVAVEFTQILLNLTDSYDIPDFIGLRLKSMIALCVSAPTIVAQYLTSQFYERNHTIRYRLDVLEILLSASEELSNGPQKLDKLDVRQISLAPKELLIAENHWTDVVQRRIDGKTKILTHKTRTDQENSRANAFAKSAGYFFFPLMKNLSGNDITFDLLEEDHYVLGRLLYTLGIIMKNVSQTPIARQMGRELLRFIWTFRYHSEVYVREALIYDLCMIVISVPPIHLFNELSEQLLEFQQWLTDIAAKDANSGCVQKACTSLQLIKDMASKTNIF